MDENELDNKTPSLIGMITNPKRQFKIIKQNPILLSTIIVVTIIFVVGTMVQMTNIPANEMMDAELEAILGSESEKVVHMLNLLGGGIAGLFMPVIIALFSSFIYWIVAKLIKSNVTFRQLLSMNIYILFISAIGLLLNGVIVMISGGSTNMMVTSLSIFVQNNPMLEAILMNFELFAIWSLILTALGLQIVAQFSKTTAWVVTILFFFIGIVFSMVGTAFEMIQVGL